MIGPVDQRFLWAHYRPQSAAQALGPDEEYLSLRKSMYCGCGPNRPWFDTRWHGIEWWPDGRDGPKRVITWRTIRRHRDAQPPALIIALDDALDAIYREARRHWEAMTAIADQWYTRATPAQRAALDAESAQHWATARELAGVRNAALLTILPAALDDGPTDLIEYAATLEG